MRNIGSHLGIRGRLLSVTAIAVLAFALVGPTAALAAPVSAPTITSAVETYFKVGVPKTFTVTTSGNPAPAITASGTPAWITFVDNGDGTATLSGTAPSGAEGDHSMTITAANGVLPNAIQAFTLGVGCSVTITSANSTTFFEGEAGTFLVTGTTTCSGTITWSTAGPLPGGVAFPAVDNGNAGATLAGTPDPGTAAAGPYPFTINASDGDNFAIPQSFTLTVGPPLVVTSDAFSATEGASFSGQVGHFTGGNGPFTATIDWGDGTTDTGTIAAGNVTGTHTYAEEGSMSVIVSVTDAGTTKSSTLAESVADANLNSNDEGAVPVVANEGATFSGQVMTFSDQDPGGIASDYTAVIAWGDGTTSAGTVTATDGSFAVTGTHVYEEWGSYSGTTTVTDAGGSTATSSLAATIAEVSPLVVTGDNITATAGVSFTGKVGSFFDPGSKEATSDYVVTINWGDGTASTAATLIDPPGTLLVDGTHTYAAVGTYTITISARESDVQTFALGTGSATVGALPLTSAPARPLPLGFLLIAAVGLLLAGGSVVAWRRRTVPAPSEG